MARVQTQYQGRGEQTQAVAAPTLITEQARFDPNDSGAYQLAKQLGALDTEGLSSRVNAVAAAKAQEDRLAAEAYANSITVDELGKRIKDGTMLPSQSPAFVGALQHIYGENTQATFQRDTLSKLQSGELKFASEKEMDEYLVTHRNEALAGQSQYTVAGFDKGYNGFREKAIDANAQRLNKESVERGVQESSDKLGNDVLKVTAADFKGNPEDAAGVLLSSYQLLTKTSLLRDDARKEALNGVLTTLASSGHTAITEAFLNKKLDSGVTVRAVLGETKAASLLQHAEAQNDKAQRQRVDVEIRPFVDLADKGELGSKQKEFDDFIKANEKYLTTSTIHAITNGNRAALDRAQKDLAKGQLLAAAEASQHAANQAVQVAAAQGNLAFLPQQKVLNEHGEMVDFKTKEAAQAALTTMTAKLPFGKQVEMWSTNGVENPEWEKQIKGGVSNVASVGWNYDGKTIGQLNPQGQAALDTFIKINSTNPGYAQKLAGGDKDYKLLSDVQFLVEKGGFPNVSDAAALVNQVNRSDIKAADYGTMSKKVHAAVEDVVNPGFFGGITGWIGGLFGNDQVNLTSVSADIRRRAELLVMSGQVPDANAAVKATVEYMANPAVTSRVNNTLYFNKDLPAVPKGEQPAQWMERFIKEVPGKIAKDSKMGAVRLEPNQGGGYTAWTGGVPMVDANNNVVTYRKEEVSQWVDKTLVADRNFAADLQNFKARGAVEMKKKSSLSNDDLILQNNLFTPEGFKRVLADGNKDKPFSELKKIYSKK